MIANDIPMSTTITLSMSQPATAACPSCGVGLPETDHSRLATDAQQQIEDLQAQVRLLNEKATAAGMFSPSPSPPLSFAKN